MKQKSSCSDKCIYLLQRFEYSCTHFQADQFFAVNPQKKIQIYQYKNTVTKNNKIQLVIMELSSHTLSSKNNGAELMFLFSIGLSLLINKLSLISNRNLLVP